MLFLVSVIHSKKQENKEKNKLGFIWETSKQSNIFLWDRFSVWS